MGFNRRKMEDERRTSAEKEAASRRATDAQVPEDAERLIAAWNERQSKRMRRRSAPRSRQAIGSCGCAVPLAEQSMRLICARSTVAATRPWSVEETAACFIVRNSGGQAPAYVY
jgi:hypothetical protein